MNARRRIRIAVMAAAVLAAGIAAGAQPGPGDGAGFGAHRPPMERALGPMGAHGRWWNDPDLVEKLKLTDDQRKAMDGILQQHREKLVDLHGNLEKAELALDPLMSADQPNESAIVSQIDKVAQARAELEKANARFLLAIRARLNPDQWKQLQAMRNERHRGPEHREMDRRGWRDRSPGTAPAPPPAPGPQGLLDPPPSPDSQQ